MRALSIVVVLTRVAAAEPPPSPPPTPAQPWSWTPLVSELISNDGVILGGEIRVRHSTEANFEPSTISLGFDYDEVHRYEPYVMFGADTLHRLKPNPNHSSPGLAFADLHVGIGGGYDHNGFVLGRLSAGFLFAPIASGHYTIGYGTANRYRLSSQLGLMLEVRASDGELRVGFGLELDPIRIIPQAWKLLPL